jgi:hypothetical protein
MRAAVLGWHMIRIVVSIGLLLSLGVNAQEEAAVVPPNGPFFVGSPFLLGVALPKKAPAFEPDFSALNTDFAYLVADRQAMPKRGNSGPMEMLRIHVLPKKPGDLELPAIPFASGDATIQTPPWKLTVKAPEESDEFSLSATLSATRCFVGQPLSLDCTWTIKTAIERITAVDIQLAHMRQASFSVLEPADNPKPGDKNSIGLPVSQTRVLGTTDENRIHFRRIVVPRQEGSFAIPGSRVLCSLDRGAKVSKRDGFRYPSYFDNQFFDEARGGLHLARVFAHAKEQTITVQPLPPAPRLFTGQFGSCTLAVSIEPKSVQVGDPVTLTVEISDNPFPEVIELPPFEDMPEFTRQFEIPGQRAPGLVREGKKIFRKTLIPRSDTIISVPVLRFVYFDPETGEFGDVRSEAIPLEVKPAAIAGASDAVLSDGSRLRNSLSKNTAGIHHNFSGPELLSPPVSKVLGQSPLVWLLALLLPPLVCLLVNHLTRYQQLARTDPAAARAGLARRQFRRALQRGRHSLEALYNAMRRYQSDKALGHVAEFADVLAQVENALFTTNGKGDAAPLWQAASRAIDHIEAGR